MKQIVQNYKTGKLEVLDVPSPIVSPGGVLVKNVNSLISVGTEKLVINLAKKSLISKALARPDLVKKVINKMKQEGLAEAYRQSMARLEELTPLGYSSAGEVLRVGQGAEEFKIGDRIACAGSNIASHAETIFVPKNLCTKIPENVSFEEASFGNVGAIALHGVRMGEPTIGEKVVIIGLGLLGQIALQILKANGCQVFCTDIDESKVKLAKELGADGVAVMAKDDIIQRVKSFSGGIGADIVYIFASTYSNQPIEISGEIARERGRIVIIGEITINIPRKIYYEKELKVVVSRSSGPGIYDPSYEQKGIDYPISYVRWTLKRNIGEFLRLVNEKKVKLESLITHRFKIDEAMKAYEMILAGKERYIGVVLEYEKDKKETPKIEFEEAKTLLKPEKINIGFVGIGLHSKGVLLPILKKIEEINLLGVADIKGVNAQDVAKKFGFSYCTTDYKKIIEDKSINAVLIATPHNLHAKMLIEALEKGKDVFLEKPLALNEKELKKIIEVKKQKPSRVMIGFNRRFSPFALLAKKSFEWYSGPFVVNCRINLGYIPKEHWVHDLNVGGGNIVGEVCHFIDLIEFLIGSLPVEVYAKTISGEIREHIPEDNLVINLKMMNGSVASITYTALGTKNYPREKIEVFGGGSVAVIDNFKTFLYLQDGNKVSKSSSNIDKGHYNEISAFFRAIKKGENMPVRFEEYVYTTLTTFKILESIKKGSPQVVNLKDLN